jgi:hypothetical protein
MLTICLSGKGKNMKIVKRRVVVSSSGEEGNKA